MRMSTVHNIVIEMSNDLDLEIKLKIQKKKKMNQSKQTQGPRKFEETFPLQQVEERS